ncbi:MAG: hypothetical protein AB7O24_06080 [Kofleriaceae bacterium]
MARVRPLVSTLVLAIGCGGTATEPAGTTPTKPQPTATAAPPVAATDPWGTKTEAPTKPASDNTNTDRKRAEAALARLAAVQTKLAALRELPFDRQVPAGFQETKEFREALHREIAKELPADKAANTSAAAFHLGFLEKPVNLAEAMEEMAAREIAAYYDPSENRFFYVRIPDSESVADMVSAHELTHALQDQHFDLEKYISNDLESDALIARSFVGEGDATFTMFGYLAKLPTLAATDLPKVEQFIRAMNASIDLDDLSGSPPALALPTLLSYSKGAVLAQAAFKHGGWNAVNNLYKTPPDSSEQALHPETKLYPKRDRPHRVTLAKLPGVQIDHDVIGELMWWVYFRLWHRDAAELASEGWGGDRYLVVRQPDGNHVGVIATSWDSVEDAKQFADAYTKTLVKRFPSPDNDSNTMVGVPRSDHGRVFVKLVKNRVFIVDGASDPTLINQLVKTTKFTQ